MLAAATFKIPTGYGTSEHINSANEYVLHVHKQSHFLLSLHTTPAVSPLVSQCLHPVYMSFFEYVLGNDRDTVNECQRHAPLSCKWGYSELVVPPSESSNWNPSRIPARPESCLSATKYPASNLTHSLK